MEIFNQEFDEDLIAKINESAKKLKASPSYKPPKTDTIRMSVFGRLGKASRSESDESDIEDELDATPPLPKALPVQRPISLQPKVKVVGFDI